MSNPGGLHASMDFNENAEIHKLLAEVDLGKLCQVAGQHRSGVPCYIGNHTIGGFNIIQELLFDDGVVWLARVPIPSQCYQPTECTLSYVAVLRYIKKHANGKIPVPEVYHYALESDPGNPTGMTYILMERLPGHALPTLELESEDASEVEEEDEDEEGSDDNNAANSQGDDLERSLSPKNDSGTDDITTESETIFEELDSKENLAIAQKVHEQLTDIIVELASLKFDKIGSLREGPDGSFFVTEYVDPNSTATPEQRATAFRNLKPEHQGPFSTVSEFYKASCALTKAHVQSDPEEEEYREDMMYAMATLEDMIPRVRMDQLENGPFVLFHNDLTVQNILVDDDFNVTGILDFSGTTAAVQSLCVYPWLFYDNFNGPVARRELFYEVFTTREASNPSSALASKELRKRLLESAEDRQNFERSLQGVYTEIMLPMVYKSIYGREYRKKDEQ